MIVLINVGLFLGVTISAAQSHRSTTVPETTAARKKTSLQINPVQEAVDSYVRGDLSSSLSAWRKLADDGNAFAQTWVGHMYLAGLGVTKNEQEAKRYGHLAVDQGDRFVNYFPGGDLGPTETVLQSIYGKDGAQNSNVDRDYVEAFASFRRSAERGQPVAARVVGNLCAVGAGVVQDWTAAINWWKRASDGNDAPAMFFLGEIYSGAVKAVPEDPTMSLKYYEKAAVAGSANAMEALGVMYGSGSKGVKQDYLVAESWFLKLKQKEPDEGRKQLRLLYSRIADGYLLGEGMAKDDVEGAKWLRKGVSEEDPRAANRLAGMYRRGQGVPKDDTAAIVLSRQYIEFLRKDAESGNRYAMKELADKYSGHRNEFELLYDQFFQDSAKGESNTPRDYAEAVRWYQKFIDGGPSGLYEPEAMASLATLYENGQGVSPDRVQAYMWYNLAIAYTPSASRDRISTQWSIALDKLARGMTKEQIAEAQILSRDWHDKHGGQRVAPVITRTSPSKSASEFPESGPAKGGETAAEAIARIEASAHSSLPSVQAGIGTGPITIRNDTVSTLTVYFSGSANLQQVIPANGQIQVNLVPGTYRVAGELSDKSVVPFFGERQYQGGETERFYVAPR